MDLKLTIEMVVNKTVWSEIALFHGIPPEIALILITEKIVHCSVILGDLWLADLGPV